jgi:putative flippase GtrA
VKTAEKIAPRPLSAPLDRAVLRRESRHAVKYGIVGVSNVAIDFAVYALLLAIGVWYPAAKVLSFVVATVNGYTFNRLWTFRAGAHRATVLTKYVTVQVSGLGVNLVLLVVLVEVAGFGQLVAQGIALPFVALASFLGQRLWTFDYAVR